MCTPSSPIVTPHQFRLEPTLSPGGGVFRDEERPFTCPEPGCFQRFKRKFTLAEHIKTHTGERPFVCPVRFCGKSFATSGNLARHKRLHPWLKPQACLVAGCGRSFSNEVKLERHLKTHFKGPARLLPCKIEGCDKSFSTAGNLTRHLKHQHREHYHRNQHTDSAFAVCCSQDTDAPATFIAQADAASKGFDPLVWTQQSLVSDDELREFLDGLF